MKTLKKALAAIISAVCLAAVALPVSACGDDAHAHTYSSAWSHNKTQHWYAATCGHSGEKLAAADHVWGEPVITLAATETSDGKQVSTCLVCGATKTEEIAAGHTFAEEWTADEVNHWHAATCAHSSETSDSAAHTWGQWQTLSAATHTEVGLDIRTCTVCGFAQGQDTATVGEHTFDVSQWASDASGHWFASDCGHDEKQNFTAHNFSYVIADSTKTEADGKYDFIGYHRKKCTGGNSSCNYVLWESHSYSWETLQQRTCSQDGISKGTCACGFVKTTVSPAAHSFAADWSADENYHWHALTCEHAGNDSLLNKIAHTFTEGVVTENGDGTKTITRSCIKCGYLSVRPVTGITSFELEAKVLSNRGTPTGLPVYINDGVVHVLPDTATNFDFINMLVGSDSADSAAISAFAADCNKIKVYEVADDGAKTELSLSTEPKMITVDRRNTTITYFQLKITDGASHRIRVESELASKEFTVIPDAPTAIAVRYSLDNGATWNDYTKAVTISAGQKVLLTCDCAYYSYSGMYSDVDDEDFGNMTFTQGAPVAGMNKIIEFTALADLGGVGYGYYVDLGVYNKKKQAVFNA